MKRCSTLLWSFLLTSYCFGQTISPDETTENCPHTDYANAVLGQPNVIRFEIDFGNSSAANYSIVTGSGSVPVGCKVVRGLMPISTGSTKGDCFIAFQDQRAATPAFTVTGPGVNKTFKFPFIRSLKGLKPTLSAISPLDLPLCTTGSIPYTFTALVKYKRADTQAEFGNAMPMYEYSVPTGWKVGSTVSTGPNHIIQAVPNAVITYDELHTGEVKIRASQAGYLCGLPTPAASGDWATIPFTRPVMKLTAGGNTSVPFTCGVTSTRTFTIDNSSQATCASYEWNLGSANNNWIYNGNPAPQIITTSTGSLTLTMAACGGVPSNVGVAVKINNVVAATFSVPVTFTPPQFTIAGNYQICQPENYTINNLPCTASVSWTISNTSLATLSTNGNTATVTAQGYGVLKLTGTITGVCGAAPIVVEKNILAGDVINWLAGPYDPVQHMELDVACVGNTYYFSPMTNKPGLEYFWTITPPPGPNSYTWNFTGPTAYFDMVDLGCYHIQMEETGGCLGAYVYEKTVCTQECWGGEFSMAVSPNPAKDMLIVSLGDQGNSKLAKAKTEPVRITLFNFNTGAKEKEWVFNTTQKQYTLNIKGLKKGMHFITITKGKMRKSKKLIIE